MYYIYHDEHGKTCRVSRLGEAGAEEDISLNTGEKWDEFIAWMGRYEGFDCSKEREPDAVIITGVREVVEYCKRRRLILFTDVGRKTVQGAKFHMERGCTLATRETAYRLSKAIPAESWLANAEFHQGLFSDPCEAFAPLDVIHEMNQLLLSDDDTQAVRRISNIPIKRAFVYCDISDFSKYHPGHQALIINSLLKIVELPVDSWSIRVAARDAIEGMEAKLCIGDGYIFVFPKALHAVWFAARLATVIEELGAKRKIPIEFHFRMGVHVGEVYSFWDSGRNGWNYIGEGINGGNRVLSAMGKNKDDAVFVSGQVKSQLTREYSGTSDYYEILEALDNRGRVKDKHGNPWRVYELNHYVLANM